MQAIPEDSREWVWADLSRFAGIERPRIIRWESVGVPSDLHVCRDNLAILGEERHFHHTEGIAAVLSAVSEALRLDPMTVRSQAEFFRLLFASFFANSSAPAWMTVIATRHSFPQRMQAANARVSNAFQLENRVIPIAWAKRSRIMLNGQAIPLRGSRFFHHYNLPDRSLKLHELIVHRSLEGDGLGPFRSTREHWFFLASPDPKETTQVVDGNNPSLELYRDELTRLRTAPMVTLCRFADDRQRILCRCICLRPFVGEVIDLRSVRYSTDYLFRSDQANHWIIQELLTSGRYEPF